MPFLHKGLKINTKCYFVVDCGIWGRDLASDENCVCFYITFVENLIAPNYKFYFFFFAEMEAAL